MLPGFGFRAHTNADGSAHYGLRISAQNGEVNEELYFKAANNPRGWVYEYIVTRTIIINGKPTAHVLKQEEWREPPKPRVYLDSSISN
jgi:hypothetical protein